MCDVSRDVSCDVLCGVSCDLSCDLSCDVSCDVLCDLSCDVSCDHTAYQKILTWSPLLEFISITMGGAGGSGEGGKTVKVKENISIEVNLKSLAPKVHYMCIYTLDRAVNVLQCSVNRKHRDTQQSP